MRRAALPILLSLLPLAAPAEVLRIDGPQGALEGEALPAPGAKHVLVIIPGSGATDRDGNSPASGMRSDTYLLLAEGLAAQGVASVRIDKRGMFGSSAAIEDGNAVSITDYAEDARDWAAKAAELAPCVWLAGHSEGGLVALVAATEARPESLCGVIELTAPGRPLGKILLAQIKASPANAPLVPEVTAIVADLEAGKLRSPEDISAPLRDLFSPAVQPYLIDLFAHDPAAIAAAWAGPALIVEGDADIQILPEDADLLAQAMPQAARLDLAGATHMLKVDRPGQPLASYMDPAMPLHPDLVPGIMAFLAENPPESARAALGN